MAISKKRQPIFHFRHFILGNGEADKKDAKTQLQIASTAQVPADEMLMKANLQQHPIIDQ